ncbi:precorrin-6y C5,15-methyltransferase (decarboxylating) subunit CbiE [Sulfitobacter aestuarii]|uniref:Precorrin-6y C5,15-methyltransferase (Decarboxylating) subunit CbiE n=1 Tax=Sulfitobacter aestuarii TaxID=2161676 RepID=A0ABW5U896_9RHOB
MSDPWLSIIGLNEDSLAGLSPASRAALDDAEIVFGGKRHLELAEIGARGRAWPVPFALDPVLEHRGKRVAVLASGDPFWFGVGGSVSAVLERGEYRVFPAPSTFSLAAAHLGWRLEEITCHGLHAAPLAQLRGALAPRARMICLLREGAASRELAQWLTNHDAGAAKLWIMESLGGPKQRVRQTVAENFDLTDVTAPVAVAVALPENAGLSRASGLPDELFAHDGQITKRPVRALTLSALAPRPGELLWDIGAGSGSISVEWCLAGGRALAFETKLLRAANIRRNARDFGLANRLTVIEGNALMRLDEQELPDAVFVGGGGSDALFETLFKLLPEGTRLVANGVTLETEARLAALHARRGGELLRIELAQAAPLGRMRGWQSARPVVQWSVVL